MFASLLQLGSNHMFQRQNIFRFSICPIPVNTVYQERPEGISSNLAHTPTWTQGWTCLNLVVKDQSHWPQGFYISRTPWGKFLDFGQNVLHILSFRWLSSHHVLNRPSKRLCINSLWMKTTCFSLESYVNIHYMSGQTSTLLNSEHHPHTLCASAVLAVLLKDNDGLLSGCAEKQTKKKWWKLLHEKSSKKRGGGRTQDSVRRVVLFRRHLYSNFCVNKHQLSWRLSKRTSVKTKQTNSVCF